ncbi:hypothetical protein ACFOW6_09995 [Fodinicurvata halophila]|uniref:PH (Pleckstrin Homology) domain-containing protein n=1 Tax=Fodinicurvata halophila TaxID=1419723 RepID=A0ABV8UKW6_9PROT
MNDALPIRLHYPAGQLLGDDLRALAGLVFALGLLLASDFAPLAVWICGPLALLFLLFGLRTLLMHVTEGRLEDSGLERRIGLSTWGAHRRMNWRDLEGLRLRYYATRRQRREGEGGYFQLTLRDPRGRMKFESTLAGFEDLIEAAVAAARHKGLSLDETTCDSLLHMGLDPRA